VKLPPATRQGAGVPVGGGARTIKLAKQSSDAIEALRADVAEASGPEYERAAQHTCAATQFSDIRARVNHEFGRASIQPSWGTIELANPTRAIEGIASFRRSWWRARAVQ